MFRSFSAPLVTTVASVGAIMVAVLFGGLAVLLCPSAMPAKAEPTTVQVQQILARGDVPALGEGATCSFRGWPYYEPSCQFDLRRTSGDARTVRIVALR